jgi:hypothetical protein
MSTNRRIRIGAVAGGFKNGYTVIVLDKKQFYAHRLACLYMEGYFPEHEMDHKLGVRHDNRWAEIRQISRKCNLQNCKIRIDSTSGYKGVTYNKPSKRWRAHATSKGKSISLGKHPDILSAALARITWEDQCPEWQCDYRCENRIKVFHDFNKQRGYSN